MEFRKGLITERPNGDDAWDSRPSTDSWHPRADGGYRDDAPLDHIPSAEKGAGYGVGVGAIHGGPSKQASVDQAYLEHPSKANEASVPVAHTRSGSQGGNVNLYDPPGAPPSYGHETELPHHDQSSTGAPPWQQQQAFNPYQPSNTRM